MHACIERNGNPLQYSCLENPRDGGTWWAAICGVAQSQARLKRLSSSSSNNDTLASFVAQLVKSLLAMWETWVRSLGLGRSPGERKGYPLQYSGLEYSMDCIVHGVAKSQTQLRNFHITSLFSARCAVSSTQMLLNPASHSFYSPLKILLIFPPHHS